MSIESPETHEEEPGKIEFLTIESLASVDLDTIRERAVTAILDNIAKPPKRDRHLREQRFREQFGLPPDLPFETALRQNADERARDYTESLETTQGRFRQQTVDCQNLALQRGYIEFQRPLTIALTDKLLHYGIGPHARNTQVNAYRTTTDTIAVDIHEPNVAIAHEVGHALSTPEDRSRSGFVEMATNAEGKEGLSGNGWFNEGVTMLWQEESVNDGSRNARHDDPTDINNWMREATKLLLDAANVNAETALRAYFGNTEARRQLETALQQRFHASLNELKCLGAKTDLDLTRKIVNGEPVDLRPSPHAEEYERSVYEKLRELFPNVRLLWPLSSSSRPARR